MSADSSRSHLAAGCNAVIRMQRFNLPLDHGTFQAFIQAVEAVDLQGILAELLGVAQRLT